ncbi:MAG: valine--tRNA ligase [Candidatus Diapherotrites archaeon]
MGMQANYNPKESEKKWAQYWEKEQIFKFDLNSEKPLYVIDTPPPTVSGLIHVGHAFSYAQAEFIARYKRMKGFNVFYPFGFDDNGLPTEKFVERERKIKATEMPRKDFVKLCLEETAKAEKEFRKTWNSIGISCDWSQFYSTISPEVQRLSQHSFIELYEKGREYRKEAVTLWCPECRTAISQVELEDKELSSKFNDVLFGIEGTKEKIIISTTRPELLSACVAVLVHPDEPKTKKLIGKKALVPLFNYLVPIIADQRVDPKKGSGIVMCCTFGDTVDIEWWKAYGLPLKIVINPDGKLNEKAGRFAGKKLNEAREAILQELKKEGLLKEQKSISHTVNVHDRCGTEIEFLVSKQWFIKYLDLKQEFLEAGKKIRWFPEHMKHRYDNWIKGLQWDWCISRQRYYGVPFPVWYCKKCNEIILADKKSLPVDPLIDKPKKPCPKCNGTKFEPEKDVLDTWATSSLTPLIISEWQRDEKKFKKLFPNTLRPQAHDIITFWAFNTIVKSLLHTGKVPWKDIMISGWCLDPKGKKMSKSKGNAITPTEIIEKYSADALRFWASSINLGQDAPFMEKDVATGQKFVTKLWNASKFSLQNLSDYKGEKPKKLEAIDAWLIHNLNLVVKEITEHFDAYEYGKAKAILENFFWHSFCDYYLEIIKDRLYNSGKKGKEGKISAQYALNEALLSVLKCFAPFMPFISEEIYQMYYAKKEGKKSIHLSSFPEFRKEFLDEKNFSLGEKAVELIGKVRQEKARNQKSMKAEVILSVEEKLLEELKPALEDIKAVCNAKEIRKGKEFRVEFS